MIPSDVVSRIKLATDLTAAPTAPAAKVKDALSDLIPGQRVLATIQAMMPNGTYRAMVAQREVVLSLPNSAKSGDTLELQVVENDGKIAFALLTDHESGAPVTQQNSVSTTLSRTGQLIGDLLAPPGKEGQKASPAPLNGNQPLIAPGETPKGADLVPVLKQAITQSGLFYESHQAQWAEGRLPTATLILQPQGQLSAPQTQQLALANPQQNPFAEALEKPINTALPTAHNAAQTELGAKIGLTGQADPSPANSLQGRPPDPVVAQQPPSETGIRQGQPVAPEVAPLVQQQLEALATQNYAWQGQVWDRQTMDWEITDRQPQAGNDENDYRWQTRLHLRMPILGEVSATLRLRGENQIDLSITTDNPDTEMQLSLGGPALNQQMADAGLYLAMFGVAQQQDDTP